MRNKMLGLKSIRILSCVCDSIGKENKLESLSENLSNMNTNVNFVIYFK